MNSQFAHLKCLANKPILYIGEVGAVNIFNKSPDPHYRNMKLFKYGISDNVYRRIAYSHMKKFDYFDLHLMRETPVHRLVESLLTRELKKEGIHVKMSIRGHVHRELFVLENNSTHLEWVEKKVDSLIEELVYIQNTK